MMRILVAVMSLALACLASGCRSSCSVAVTIFGDIQEPVVAVTTADKDYEGVDIARGAKGDLSLSPNLP